MNNQHDDDKATTSPELAKQFKEDLETVKRNIHAALASIAAESDLKDALEILKKMHLARFEAGRALKRISETRSYRAQFRTFEDFCQELDVHVRTAYFMVSDVAIYDSCGPELEKIAGFLSQKKLRAIGKLSPEERASFVSTATSETDPAAVQGKFRELFASLKKDSRPAPNDEFPKQRIQKAENGLAWMRRVNTLQALWFEARGGMNGEFQAALDTLLKGAIERAKKYP